MKDQTRKESYYKKLVDLLCNNYLFALSLGDTNLAESFLQIGVIIFQKQFDAKCYAWNDATSWDDTQRVLSLAYLLAMYFVTHLVLLACNYGCRRCKGLPRATIECILVVLSSLVDKIYTLRIVDKEIYWESLVCIGLLYIDTHTPTAPILLSKTTAQYMHRELELVLCMSKHTNTQSIVTSEYTPYFLPGWPDKFDKIFIDYHTHVLLAYFVVVATRVEQHIIQPEHSAHVVNCLNSRTYSVRECVHKTCMKNKLKIFKEVPSTNAVQYFVKELCTDATLVPTKQRSARRTKNSKPVNSSICECGHTKYANIALRDNLTTKIEDKFYIHSHNASRVMDQLLIAEAVRTYAWSFTTPKCLVLCCGSNIGAPSKLALIMGASHVTCVEPELSNYRLLAKNLNTFTLRATIKRNIVVDDGNHSENSTLFVPDNRVNMGSCSVYSTRNKSSKETVPCVKFSDLLHEKKYTVLQMDIEGAEWDILLHNDLVLPDSLVRVTIECHFPTTLFKTSASRSANMKKLYNVFDQRAGWKTCNDCELQEMYGTWHTIVRFWRAPVIQSPQTVSFSQSGVPSPSIFDFTE